MIGTFKPAPAKMNGPKVVKPAPAKGEVAIVEVGQTITIDRYQEIIARQEDAAKQRRR